MGRKHLNVYPTKRRRPWPLAERRTRGIWEVWNATRDDYPGMPDDLLTWWTITRYQRLLDQQLTPADVRSAINQGRKNGWTTAKG